MSVVELAPVVKQLQLRRSAEDAFRIFTEEMSAWWPIASHSLARDVAGEKTVKVTVEPHVGGRVFETLNTGEERNWGEVLAWEPGTRFAMLWQMGRPREQAGEVDVHFETLDHGSCRVTLTHSHWERLGALAAEKRDQYANGWEFVFGECFANYAGRR